MAEGNDWTPLILTIADPDIVGCSVYMAGQAWSVQWSQDRGAEAVTIPVHSSLRQVHRFDRAIMRAILQETLRKLDFEDIPES